MEEIQHEFWNSGSAEGRNSKNSLFCVSEGGTRHQLHQSGGESINRKHPQTGREARNSTRNPGVPPSPWRPSFQSRIVRFLDGSSLFPAAALLSCIPARSSRQPDGAQNQPFLRKAAFPECLSPSGEDRINLLPLRIYGASAQSQ